MAGHPLLRLWVGILSATAVCPPLLAGNDLPVLAKRIAPSTVIVRTYDSSGKPLGVGSGFFVSKKGEIVTNRHVLRGAHRAEIQTANDTTYSVSRVIAEDKEGDLIRLSTDSPTSVVRPLVLCTSVPLVGERVLVVGNPLGLERTVSDGIVSAVREIPQFGKIIQITAPISSGSSGSPVVNMKGEVVGVATFLLVTGQNLNFAIPAERVAGLKSVKGRTFAAWVVAEAEKSKVVDSVSAEDMRLLGVAYSSDNNYKMALYCFEAAVKLDSRNAETHFQIGYCHDRLGHFPEAIEAYKQAIRLKRDDAGMYLNLGLAYRKLGRTAEEIDTYKECIRLNPDFAEVRINLAWVYYELGRIPEVIETYKQAIRVKPNCAEAHYGLGVTYGKLGRTTEAIEENKEAIRLKPDYAEAHYSLGVAYGILGRDTEAIEACKQAIRIKPDYAGAHRYLGLSYRGLGRTAEAIEAYKQAICIKPDDAEVHYLLGLSYLILRDSGAALDEYRILKGLDKDLAKKLFDLIYP